MDIRLAAVLMCCLGSGGGCGLIMVGDPVQEMDLTSQDDAEENLKAIRAMLADQESQRSEERLSDTSRQPTPPDAAPSLIEPSYGQRPAPSPSSSAGRTEAPAKLQSSPPVPVRPAMPDYPVPAYTIREPFAVHRTEWEASAAPDDDLTSRPSMQQLQKNGGSSRRAGFKKRLFERRNRCLPQRSAHRYDSASLPPFY